MRLSRVTDEGEAEGRIAIAIAIAIALWLQLSECCLIHIGSCSAASTATHATLRLRSGSQLRARVAKSEMR